MKGFREELSIVVFHFATATVERWSTERGSHYTEFLLKVKQTGFGYDNFLISGKIYILKPGARVCSLHFEGQSGPKPWCPVPTLFPSIPVNTVNTSSENMANASSVRRQLIFNSDVEDTDTEVCDTDINSKQLNATTEIDNFDH